MIEQWKDINGYEGLYAVSSEGNVMTHGRTVMTGKNLLRTYERKILSYGITRGYKRVVLCKNGITKNMSIARLVGFHFVNGWFPGAQINHLNGNKLDNRAENLEWATSKQNTAHAHNNGLVKGFERNEAYRKLCSEKKQGLNHPFSKVVLDLKSGVFYYSVSEAAFYNDISRSTLNWWFRNPHLNPTALKLLA